MTTTCLLSTMTPLKLACAVALVLHLAGPACALDCASVPHTWASIQATIDSYANIGDSTVIIAAENGKTWTHQKGVMRLTDHPQQYISFWTSDPSDARSRITLEQLLSLTGGFGADTPCLSDNTITLDACVREIYDTNNPLPYSPGSTFYYGGSNLQVAGLMAVNAAGAASWNALYSAQVRVPLGINIASFYVSLSNPRIAGGLLLSGEGYASLLKSLYFPSQPTRLLNASTIAAMDTDHTPTASVAIAYSPITAVRPRRSGHYGLAHWLECPADAVTYTNGTCGNVLSSPGKFAFYPFYDRQYRFIGVTATADYSGELAFTRSINLWDVIGTPVRCMLADPSTSTPPISYGGNGMSAASLPSSLVVHVAAAVLVACAVFFR